MIKKPSTASHQRIYTVGDIHGRADLLARLLAMIEEDAMKYPKRNKKLIFLGDYIDRGLESKAVIDRLLQPFAKGLAPVFLRGNHDDYLLSYLKGDLGIMSYWSNLGGTATLASYGVNLFGAGNKADKAHHGFVQKLPAAHKAFFRDTLLSVSFGDYYFVHAGVRPHVPLAKQKAEDKMTIRGDFLFSDYVFESIIVHGHTIKPEPEIKPNRIGLDTGAFATGHLTCLVLDGTTKKFLIT